MPITAYGSWQKPLEWTLESLEPAPNIVPAKNIQQPSTSQIYNDLASFSGKNLKKV